jgi:anaerobic selenocysteine-containing dehydrogenase
MFNERGYVVLRAWLSQTILPGTVYISQGWQSRDFKAGHAQSLTHEQGNSNNAFGINISFSDVLVEIVREPAAANE